MKLWCFKQRGPANGLRVAVATTEQEARKGIELDGSWDLRACEDLPPGIGVRGVANLALEFGRKMRREGGTWGPTARRDLGTAGLRKDDHPKQAPEDVRPSGEGVGSAKLWYFRQANPRPIIWEVEARSEDEAVKLLPEGLWVLIGNTLCNCLTEGFPIRKFTLEVDG